MTNKKPKLFTPWRELERFGFKRVFLSRWKGFAAAAALIVPAIVPWGQIGSLQLLAEIHAVLLGFGLTVFGFTILGGKDDFFEPVMKSQGKEGLDALRDMVLLLWWPLILHGAALLLCLSRLMGRSFIGASVCAAYAWRVAYVFVMVWAMIQTYHSMRYLFVLAITRLHWRFKELGSRESDDTPTVNPREENKT